MTIDNTIRQRLVLAIRGATEVLVGESGPAVHGRAFMNTDDAIAAHILCAALWAPASRRFGFLPCGEGIFKAYS